MKKIVLTGITLGMLLFAGCGSKESTLTQEEIKTTEAYSYKRNTIAIELPENVHPYRIDYGENGLFCLEEYQTGEEDDNLQNEYVFYYQEYSESESRELCRINQYVNGFHGNSESEISLLIADEKTVICEYNDGSLEKEINVSNPENRIYGAAYLYRLPTDEYAITYKNMIYQISGNGEQVKSITLEDTVSKLVNVGEETFAYVYAPEGGKESLLKVDFDKGQTETAFEPDDGVYTVFSFEEKLALVYQDRIVLSDTNGENRELLLDLNAQAIFASQIVNLSGTKEAFKIIVDDLEESKRILSISMTRITGEDRADEEEQGTKEQGTKEQGTKEQGDGERVTVKMVVPADYYYDIEFHAKKYNQLSDNSFIEVERIEESLEDYLGKGARPDIVMFHDNTEVPDYVQKNILTDLNPYMEEQGDIIPEDIVPVVRDMISDIDKEKTYVLATNFELLLMASDGTEYGEDGTCNIIDYFEWFDQYLTDRELTGTCNTEQFLYAVLPDFYDEETGETRFTGDEFKEIMKSYKTMRDNHEGELEIWDVVEAYGRPAVNIVNAPYWYNHYGDSLLRHEGCSFEGVPGYSKDSKVYVRLDSPMGILETSSCKEEAYDFIAYYILLNDYLTKGWTEDMYGDDKITKSRLSILQSNLDEYIFETDKPYKQAMNRATMKPEYLYYTQENLDNLKRVLESAIPVTKAQEDIYAILLEEMEPYYAGDKDLDAACEVLDSRVGLYLLERQ